MVIINKGDGMKKVVLAISSLLLISIIAQAMEAEGLLVEKNRQALGYKAEVCTRDQATQTDFIDSAPLADVCTNQARKELIKKLSALLIKKSEIAQEKEN